MATPARADLKRPNVGQAHMQFLSEGLDNVLLGMLSAASDVRIAVAYFAPDRAFRTALAATHSSRIVISGEWTLNDVESFEELAPRVRFIPHGHGKLHAKAYYVTIGDERQLLLGSANLTRPGLTSNRELCVLLTSREKGDMPLITEYEAWFDDLHADARPLDASGIQEAKEIFASRPWLSARRTRRSPEHFWVLKAWDDGEERLHWVDFQRESVIGIGWSGLGANPYDMDYETLRQTISQASPDTDAAHAARMLEAFASIGDGDLVLLMRGYAGNQRSPVQVHGFARAGKERIYDIDSSWWRCKRAATIDPVDTAVDVGIFQTFKGSMTHTIHGPFTEAEFRPLLNALRREAGIVPRV